MLVLGMTLSIGSLAFAATAHAAPWAGHQVGPAAIGTFRQTTFYQIINQNSNKCLTPIGNSTNPNVLIVQRSCENRASHQWRIVSGGTPGQFSLVNRANGFCMDLQGRSLGTLVTQSNGICDSGVTTESWLLVASNTPPYYRLQNALPRFENGVDLCADVRNRSTADDAQIQAIECKPNEAAQRFLFR